MPTRVVIDGLPRFAGDSVAARRADARRNHDGLRTMLCREPRGHAAMYAAYVVDSAAADVGVIFASQVGYDDLCGHGTIGVVTALLESGHLSRRDQVRVETPAGIVSAQVRWQGQRVAAVSFDSVPAFLHRAGVVVEVPGVGAVTGDIAFGGNWYLYLEAARLGLDLGTVRVPALLDLGGRIKQAVNGSMRLDHPTNRDVAHDLLGVSFYGPPLRDPQAHAANVVVENEHFYDRSPCGTGTCGRMAALHARGELAVGEEFRNESYTGGLFAGCITGTTTLGAVPAVLPRLTGSAWIMGRAEWSLDPTDPFGAAGF